MSTKLLFSVFALTLAACGDSRAEPDTDITPFPPVERPVSAITSNQYSDEDSREGTGEAETVLSVLGVEPGESVADIGAGRGFYMQKLAQAVGPEGQVYAQDIFPDVVEDLSVRASANGFGNVETVLGSASDPNLPPGSLDHVLMIHMYHEIENPYALLWHLHASLKPGATIAIVDADRITSQHGTPPALLECELKAMNFAQIAQAPLEDGKAYVAIFRPEGPRPAPQDIVPCENPS